MKQVSLFFSFLFISMLASAINPKVNYELTFSQAQAHYVDVKLTIQQNDKESVDFKMPVWAPGSYLVREFARNVEGVAATNAKNENLICEKINKNTWRVQAGKNSEVVFQYRVYAFELSVRTSFIDDAHAYLNGSSIFMYAEGFKEAPIQLKITPNANWKKISCSLAKSGTSPFELTAPNYDMLADAPIEIGNQDIIAFDVLGIPHEVAMVGQGNYDREKIKKDFIKIIEEAKNIFGTHPCKNYVFIVHNVNAGGGGLEHLNSSTLQMQRNAYAAEATYNGFLSLVAHEYFHLWNVKRLRPIALGPFNYDEENYTRMLWVAEGFTAFYDNWIVRRTKHLTAEKYLEVIANEFTALANLPGAKVQSLSESSFDAWIKFYRRNENSGNNQVSYYDKGSVIALMLNLAIIKNSNGTQSLDDVMKYMYAKCEDGKAEGYTDAEFKSALEKYTGQNLDSFYVNYIDGLTPIDFTAIAATAGLKITDLNAGKNEIYLGVNTSNVLGKLMVTAISNVSAAYVAGLNVNDEIIAIDNYRTDDLVKATANKKPGEAIDLLVARDGLIKKISFVLTKNNNVKYKLEKLAAQSPAQEIIFKAWIK
ncbi:MAG: M61 family metallopeptidase [Sphingobacteriaceae bacterium]|jgi:predicted metalloprotease with PDZ domain